MVAEYLPQITNNINQIKVNDSFNIEHSEVTSSIERKANNIRIKLSDKKTKVLSIPIELKQNNLFDSGTSLEINSLGGISSAPKTPTK